ncbi:hypothetical protein [Agrobacterium vitis]|nr:hypothetical protein [Agrobacterium vitis]
MEITQETLSSACAALIARGKGNNVTIADIRAMLEAAFSTEFGNEEQPRYTTRRLREEIAKAEERGRQYECETAGAEDPAETLQSRVQPWMIACFGPEISADKLERGDRLLEEVFELLQSGDYPRERIRALEDYTWARPKGAPAQEVGGVMVTLAAYCLAHDLNMHEAGEIELARIWTKVEKIRAKQAAKPTGSALPIAVAKMPAQDVPVTLNYTNYRGETSERTILPKNIWFGSTEWHPEPQWLLTAFDLEKKADRDFALKDFGKSPSAELEPFTIKNNWVRARHRPEAPGPVHEVWAFTENGYTTECEPWAEIASAICAQADPAEAKPLHKKPQPDEPTVLAPAGKQGTPDSFADPKLLIIGSEGIVGRRLKSCFPSALTMDATGSPTIRADILDCPNLPDCDVVIMLACASNDPNLGWETQSKSLRMAEIVIHNAAAKGIPVIYASSVWAERHPLNCYGAVKRCIEQMVDSFGGISIRLGWIGHTPADIERADDRDKQDAWSDEKLCLEVRKALQKVCRTPQQLRGGLNQ